MKLTDKLVRYIIYFLIVYVPLENLFLIKLGVNVPLYILISQFSDLLVLLTAGFVAFKNYHSNTKFRIVSRGVDLYLIIFLLLAAFSTLYHQVSIMQSIMSLKVLLRFFLLIYIILNINLSQNFKSICINLFLVSVFLQDIIGISQLVLGMPAYSFFLPKSSIIEIGNTKIYSTSIMDAQKGWIIGTQARSIQFGLLNLLALLLVLSKYYNSRLKYWSFSIVIVIIIFLCGSRSIFLMSILAIVLNEVLNKGIALWLGYTLLSLPLLIILVFIFNENLFNNYVFHIFSKEYIKEASNQRLGVVTIMLPAFFKLNFIDILFGMGTDKDLLFDYFQTIPNRPKLLYRKAETIEDVYWVAILYYYGIVGLLLFVSMLYTIFKLFSNYISRLKRTFDVNYNMAILLLLSVVPLNFFNQVFEVKQFSFYFWLFIAIGLAQLKEPNNHPDQSKLNT